jgi:hypothetical protein
MLPRSVPPNHRPAKVRDADCGPPFNREKTGMEHRGTRLAIG